MKKLTILLLTVLMCLTAFGCKDNGSGKDDPPAGPSVFDLDNMNDIQTDVQKEFDALQKKWFREDMESDYLNLHFSVENPASMGITVPEVTLGEVEEDEDDTTYEDRLAELEKFKLEDLTPDQQLMYKSMKFYFQLMVDAYKIEEDYTFIFTPNSGLNNNLITNFTEFDIRCEQDAHDLITLVKDSGRYIDECIDYTKEQASKGIIQPNTVIDGILEQCERYISKVDDNELIVVFNARMDEANYADKAALKAEMVDAVKTVLIPGYQRIIDMYKELRGQSTKSGLLCDYGEDGKATYEILVRNKVSSTESIDSMIAKLEKAIDDVVKEIRHIYAEETEDYGYKELDEILKHLAESMTADYPPMPTVSYKVAYLDPSVTSENVSAYYLIAPIDNINNNVIKVNPTFVEKDINGLCITLAHEGFPGHLYQHTYYYANHPNNEYRSSLSFIGYAEGWAMYVENHAYNYFLDNEKEVEYMILNNLFSYYLYGYCDLQMHYNGWRSNQIKKYLENYIAASYAREYATSIYESNLGDPAMFLPYSLGMYNMMELCETAQKELGDKFDLKEYNKVVLDTGEAPFDILNERVNEYIKYKKAK